MRNPGRNVRRRMRLSMRAQDAPYALELNVYLHVEHIGFG